MNWKLLAITLAFFFNAFSAVAQSRYFKRYQVENGLSNSTVFCSLQDKSGFLWFGTKDGLNRFDGYNFKTFQTDTDDPHSIGDNLIRSIYQDPKGTLWIGTHSGLYTYNALNERFTLAVATDVEIKDLVMDGIGNLWYTSNQTLCKIDAKSKKISTYNSKSYFFSTALTVSANGTLWVASTKGTLEKYNAQNNW